MQSRFILPVGLLLVFISMLAACATNPTAAPAPTNAPAPTQSNNAAAPTNAPVLQPTVVSNSDAVPVMTKLNLNTSSGDDYLKTIPNFPNRMVREFLEYRPYVSIQQFRQEIGKYVGPEQVAEWEKYVYVPVDANQSDAATLKQIPGITDEVAAQLIAARPFASNDAFLAKLAALGIAQAAAAGYLQ